jgi:SSS family solute:Na+ symporter
VSGLLEVATLVGYALLVLAIAVFFTRKQGDSEGFFLGGRTLSTGQVFGTTFSTFLGTGLLFTLVAFGYRFGIGAFVLPVAAVLGLFLLALAAPRIKVMSDEVGAITLPAVMDRFWSDRTKLLAALITAALFTGTLAANLLIVGEILEVFLDVPSIHGIVAFAALVIVYTVVGGFQGVVWTDNVQTALILLVVVVVLPTIVVLGEIPVVVGSIPASHLDPFAVPLPVIGVYLLVGVFAFFGSQDLFQRIFAAKDGRNARRGLIAFTAVFAVTGWTAVGLGIAARAHLPDVAADRALLLLAETVTPTELVGIVLIGFLALANSDADSQLLTVASNVTQDVLPLLNHNSDRFRGVSVDRLVVAGIGTGAALVAAGVPSLAALLGMLGSWFAILGFAVVATLFWNRTTDQAVSVGLAVGFIVPTVFVLVTGNFQAATVVGLVPAVGIVGAVSLLSD